MKIDVLVVGMLDTNCYILRKEGHVLIIDPGGWHKKILEAVGDDIIDAILVTHNHIDHIGAIPYMGNIPVYDFNNIKEFKSDIFKFKTIYTPGHTSDSITFYFEEDKVMFVGDFIFKGSIGRLDFGGNEVDMKNSLRMIKEYSNDIVIYPGHYDKTTLGDEKKNYYFNEFIADN